LLGQFLAASEGVAAGFIESRARAEPRGGDISFSVEPLVIDREIDAMDGEI